MVLICLQHCIMHYESIRDLSQTFTTAPIFPQHHFFRQNIWVNIWVPFHFHFIFLHVTNGNKASNNGMFGDELNGALKTPRRSSKYFHNIFSDENGGENIWEIFAPRMAARIKLLFSSFFSAQPHCSTYQISELSDQPFMFFANKSKNIWLIW